MGLFFYSLLLGFFIFLQRINLLPAGTELTLAALLAALAFFTGAETAFLCFFAGVILYFAEPRLWAAEFFGYAAAVAGSAAMYNLLDFPRKIFAAAFAGIAIYYFVSASYYRFFSPADFAWFFAKNSAVFLGVFYTLRLSFGRKAMPRLAGWV